MNELFPGENIDVPDPYYGPEQGYHDVYRLIDDACDAIIKKASPSRLSGTKGGAFENALKGKNYNSQ